MLGAIPSDLIPYWDFNRFAEYLVDGSEVAPATPAALDANTRAIRLVNAAQDDVLSACRRGDFYEMQQLRDLVRAAKSLDNTQNIYGGRLLGLIADCAWARGTIRKRYTKASPQGDDPAIERSEEMLEKLRFGERLFVLDGVEQTDGAGNVTGYYGEAPERAGLMEGGQIVACSLDRATPLWGCNTGGSTLPGGTGGCCGGWDVGAG